jgi:hypothetical protein
MLNVSGSGNVHILSLFQFRRNQRFAAVGSVRAFPTYIKAIDLTISQRKARAEQKAAAS